MNLDEFKSLWDNNISAEKNFYTHESALDPVFQNTFKRVSQLARVSKFWWIVSAIGIGLVFMLLLVTTIIYMRYPRLLESLKNAVPVLILLPVFATIVGLLYYKQARIFDINNCKTVSTALHQSMIRFRNWYRFSLVAFTIILVPVYYLLLVGISFKLNITISKNANLAICILLSFFTLLLNHLQYKRTYFDWIDKLKKNMNELANTTH